MIELASASGGLSGIAREERGGTKPGIQNEFINVLSDQIRKKIIQATKEAKYFCIVFDSTPDVLRMDQTSQILRYVKVEGSKVAVVEVFVDFIETDGENDFGEDRPRWTQH
ncbi:hypothetical protein ILUMI_22333 [Ignelater luminosus]|uniref:DUF4371 domain-containing protein n=1 Tax=Ignelater luminosus TaxID=2038154 RepID=A0A8K0G2Q1_IGNLU|nr:hypothetical protein ILUMI_22333 [Ignelater luminosus]